MTKVCKLIIKDEVNVKCDGLDANTRRKICNKLKFFLPYRHNIPSVKLGRWDGSISFCDIGGRTYINLLEDILPIIQDNGYDIEIDDQRQQYDFELEKIDCNSYSHISWPAGHPMVGKPIILRDHQVKLVNDLFIDTQGISICSTGGGKAQPLYSKVLTPSGWKTMKELNVGDMVVTPTGKAVKILGVFPQGKKEVYSISTEYNRHCHASSDHLWKVCVNGKWDIHTTTQIFSMLCDGKEIFLPRISPQGCSQELYDIDMREYTDDIQQVHNNHHISLISSDKLSIDQKIKLISHHMDINGITISNSSCKISTNISLCEYIVDVLNSLGIHSWIEDFQCSERPNITFKCAGVKYPAITNEEIILAALEERNRDDLDQIRYMDSLPTHEECQCIMIDDPSHLYITDDYIVTHNTISIAILSHRVERYGRSIVIVPNKDLVVQTEADYINLGLDVGVMYGDRKEFGKKHTICTWQTLDSLYKKKDGQLEELLEGVICVITDECHRASAEVLKKLLSGPFANVPIRWGLTGTLPENDHERYGLKACIGNVLGVIKAKDLQEKGILANLHINIMQLNDFNDVFANYQAELAWLTSNKSRIACISQMISDIAKEGNVLVLVDRIGTGNLINQSIENSVFIEGSVKSAKRKEEYASMQFEDNKVIIATYGLASTGLNISRIFSLVLIEPGKSFVRVIQSIGRGLRVAEDKDFVNVYDVTSTCKYSKKHLTARKKHYKEAEYPFTIKKIDY